MKSKFSPIIKLKEQTIEEISANIAELHRKIDRQNEHIAAHKEAYLKRNDPDNGNILYFAQKQLFHVAYKMELNAMQSELAHLYGKERQLQQQLSDERLELERYNVLHEQILDETMQKAKKKEADFLDEMGSTGFANRGLF